MARNGIIACGIGLLLVGMYCCDLRGEEIKQRYEQTFWPSFPAPWGNARVGWYKPVPMTDSEVALIIKIKTAEMEIEHKKQLNEINAAAVKQVADAKAEKEADRAAAEDRNRWICYAFAIFGAVVLAAGILCLIYYADKKMGVKAIVAGVLTMGTFVWISMNILLFGWGIIGFVVAGCVIVGVWMLASSKMKKEKEETDADNEALIESGDVMKAATDWKNDLKAKAKVRVIQGAKPDQKTMSRLEVKIAGIRDKKKVAFEKIREAVAKVT